MARISFHLPTALSPRIGRKDDGYVYRRRTTPISDSDFEQPDDRVTQMPSRKKQLMLMKKFQPSKHVLRQAAPSSEDEIVIDFADPFCF